MAANCSKIPIVTYHSIDDSGSVVSTSIETLRRHLATFYEMGLTTVSVSQISAYVRAGDPLPPGCIALTFDDGFANVYEHAFPLLCKFGFTATVFLVTDYCEKLNSWPSNPREVPRLALLRWSQIQEMSRHGIHFGAHTKTHPDLCQVSSIQLETEVGESKKSIEDRLGLPVDSFSYPYGLFDSRVMTVVRDHFAAACGTQLAFVQGQSNPWCLERVDAFYLRSRLFPRHLISPAGPLYLHMRRCLRGLRRSFPSAKTNEKLIAQPPTAA